jgi:hypothetical protein
MTNAELLFDPTATIIPLLLLATEFNVVILEGTVAADHDVPAPEYHALLLPTATTRLAFGSYAKARISSPVVVDATVCEVHDEHVPVFAVSTIAPEAFFPPTIVKPRDVT